MTAPTPRLPSADDLPPDVAESHAAFGLLLPGVQRQLWQMKWQQLRPLQVKAIKTLMADVGDLILSAATASGKTEAAFLPILSRIADEPTGSIRAMYVGPLKALINDQFRRVEELCSHLEMPVWRWHGDVSAADKQRLVKEPGGVLLITPESLESLFVNRSQHLPRLFGGLRHVVIDELHSFLDNPRGLHLRSLLSRLRRLVSEVGPEAGGYRTVGLSATIGDFDAARAFINPDQPDQVQVLRDADDGKEIRYRIHGYRIPPEPEPAEELEEDNFTDPDGVDGASIVVDLEADQGVPPHRMNMAADLVEHCRGRSNLVFANAKADVEEFADLCLQEAQLQHLPDRILVHHGSLSADIRQDTEATMKSGLTATTFCSSTLEMGIDIGSVAGVGQIGPAWSVSGMLQRMGRSGRKDDQPRIMRVYIESEEADPEDNIFNRLHLPLIQAVALTELMLEKWLEPANPPIYDLSTLTQQIISVIAETAGIAADHLHERLCVQGAFRELGAPRFGELLRCLGDEDIVEQTSAGDLILGMKGEKIRNSASFYAVFSTPDKFALLHEGRLLGELEVVPRLGEFLLFAGKRWEIVEVDEERKQVWLIPAKRHQRPKFGGGIGEIHPKIRQKMREVLLSEQAYSYLDSTAQGLLSDARRVAGNSAICQDTLVPLSDEQTALMTWTGSRIQETLRALFDSQGVSTRDEDIALVFNLPLDATREALTRAANQEFNPLAVAGALPMRRRRKYDWLLTDNLIDFSLAAGWLDLAGAAGLLEPFQTAAQKRPAPSRPDREARPQNPYHWVDDPAEFERICRQLMAEPAIGLDVETTLYRKPPKLCTIQLASPRETWIIDALAISEFRPLAPLLASPQVLKVIHYAEFETEVFAGYNLGIVNIFDTCEHSRQQHPDEAGHRLDLVVARELGLQMNKQFQKADWLKRPVTQNMLAYAALDAEILLRLHSHAGGGRGPT